MNRPRILVTGAGGFSGRWLLAELNRGRAGSVFALDARLPTATSAERWRACDLCDAAALRRAVAEAAPDVVFHLAGLLGSAPDAEMDRVNVGGMRNLLEALRPQALGRVRPIRLVVVGSAAELGPAAAASLPVTEQSPCAPTGTYGRSKWEATRLALAEPAEGPLAVIVARPFNLVGPGLGTELSLGQFAYQIAAVLAGAAPAVHCKPLDSRRDFVDVRDATAAYVALARRGRPGEVYNVCAGRSYRIGDLLEQLIALSGQRVPVVVEPGESAGVPDIFGDYAKIHRAVGWKPRIPIEQSLSDLLAEARHRYPVVVRR